jgi:hypothetical protein
MQPVTLAGTKLGYIHVRGFPAAASFRILLIGGTEQLTVSCLLSGRLLRGQHTEDVELDRQSRLRREPSFQLSALWPSCFVIILLLRLCLLLPTCFRLSVCVALRIFPDGTPQSRRFTSHRPREKRQIFLQRASFRQK